MMINHIPYEEEEESLIGGELGQLSPAFLVTHRDVVLHDALTYVKAFILYPPCTCHMPCHCDETRNQVVLTLNTELYNQIEKTHSNLDLPTLRLFLKVPEDQYYRKNHGKLYPLWLIEEEFEKRKKANIFKNIDLLIWTMLRLAKSYQSLLKNQASLKRTTDRILGNTPLKAKGDKPQRDNSLWGEKAYATHFKIYKPVCHFIAAYGLIQKERGEDEGNSKFLIFNNPNEIERFLKLSAWFRYNLLPLKTPNAREKTLFPKDLLLALPHWITSEGIDLSIEPFEDIVQHIKKQFKDSVN